MRERILAPADCRWVEILISAPGGVPILLDQRGERIRPEEGCEKGFSHQRFGSTRGAKGFVRGGCEKGYSHQRVSTSWKPGARVLTTED